MVKVSSGIESSPSSQQAVALMRTLLRCRGGAEPASHLHTPVHCTVICGRDPLLPVEGGRAADNRALDMLLLASEKDLAEADTRCDSVMPIKLRLDNEDNAGTPGSILGRRMSDESDSVLVLGGKWACGNSIDLDDHPIALAPEMRFLESQPAPGNSIVSNLDMSQILPKSLRHQPTTEHEPSRAVLKLAAGFGHRVPDLGTSAFP